MEAEDHVPELDLTSGPRGGVGPNRIGSVPDRGNHVKVLEDARKERLRGLQIEGHPHEAKERLKEPRLRVRLPLRRFIHPAESATSAAHSAHRHVS